MYHPRTRILVRTKEDIKVLIGSVGNEAKSHRANGKYDDDYIRREEVQVRGVTREYYSPPPPHLYSFFSKDAYNVLYLCTKLSSVLRFSLLSRRIQQELSFRATTPPPANLNDILRYTSSLAIYAFPRWSLFMTKNILVNEIF